jgi:hypothetical protein
MRLPFFFWRIKMETNSTTQFTIQEASSAGAVKSGGPNTNRGKARSRRNAVKHGIFAKVVLLEHEPSAQFDDLLKGFREDFRPEGTVEEVLVEKLASLTWRYRRMLVAERAEIRAEQEHSSRAADREKQHREEVIMLYTSPKEFEPGLVEMRENPIILKRCIDLLKTLRIFIGARGFNPSMDDKIIRMVFGDKPMCSFRMMYCLYDDPMLMAKKEELKEYDLPLEERQKKFLEYLSGTIEDFEHYANIKKDMLAQLERLESSSGEVPETPRLDRLLKYSTSLERDFERTLNQLERLQRIRRGQPVPPTLNVTLSQ